MRCAVVGLCCRLAYPVDKGIAAIFLSPSLELSSLNHSSISMSVMFLALQGTVGT